MCIKKWGYVNIRVVGVSPHYEIIILHSYSLVCGMFTVKEYLVFLSLGSWVELNHVMMTKVAFMNIAVQAANTVCHRDPAWTKHHNSDENICCR